MSITATEPNTFGSRGSGNRCGDQVHRLLNLAATLARTSGPSPAGSSPSDTSSTPTSNNGTVGAGTYGMPLGMDAGSLSDAQSLQWAQDVEALLRWGQALAVQAAGDIEHRVASGRFAETGATGAVALLVQTLQISGREAKQRIDLAQQILPVPDRISGQVAPAAHPVLGQAVFTGQLSQDRALTALTFLKDARRLMTNGIIGQETLDDVEESLTATATEDGPDFIRAVGNQIMSHIDPDGNKPTEADLRAKQGLFFRRARNGLVGIYGHCTIEQYEQVMATISYATNPNKHKDVADINADKTDSGHDTFDTGNATGASGAATTGSSAADSDNAPGNDGAQQDSLWEQLKRTSDLLNTVTAQPGPIPPNPPNPPTPPPSRGPNSLQGPGQDSVQGWGKGWKRRLESWEVPPRPPDAPENAVAPIYEGDAWFWFGSDTPPAWPSHTPESTSTDSTTEGSTGGSRFGGGFGPGWAGGLLGSPLPSQNQDGDPWPRLINGVWVPAPGDEADLAGLDSTDPSSTDRAVEDTRTRGQKLLDGLIDCVKLAARTGSLPLNGGLKTQLILTTSEADLRRKDGLGTIYTTFSGPMPLGLFDQSLCDPEVTRLVYGDGAEIINAGRTQRLFTPPQRKLLFARDLGCSFPACTAVAIWCEAHHIIPWQQGGNTDVSNACLLCSRHHTLVHNSDWEVKLIAGTPWFTPPLQADRMRAPRRNLFHHGLTKNGKPYEPPMA